MGTIVVYRRNLGSAARRHLRSAQILYASVEAGAQPGSRAVAGYIFGLVGELALKEMMRISGIVELPENQRRSDPFYAHFPYLQALMLERLSGRREGQLRKFAENSRLFANWHTNMRYAPTDDIQASWIETWKQSAEKLVAQMDLP